MRPMARRRLIAIAGPAASVNSRQTENLVNALERFMSHPKGISAGVLAFRQAADAARAGLSPDEHATTNPELAAALKSFKRPASIQ